MDNEPPFRVGDLVTTLHERPARSVVRRVTSVEQNSRFSSKWGVSADAGERCLGCKRRAAHPTGLIDSLWFQPADPALLALPAWDERDAEMEGW